MLTCCRNDFTSTYSFDVEDKKYLKKHIEFGYCPHCKNAIYKENKTEYNGRQTVKILKEFEAEVAFQKAKWNRLNFVSRLEQGTRARQNWCFGDSKKGNQKDERGNLIQFQIRRNLNGQEVENFGVAKVNIIKIY